MRVDCDILDGGEWVLGVDGTVIRAHHHAAGARHEPPKDIPAEVGADRVGGSCHAGQEHRGIRRMTRIPARSR